MILSGGMSAFDRCTFDGSSASACISLRENEKKAEKKENRVVDELCEWNGSMIGIKGEFVNNSAGVDGYPSGIFCVTLPPSLSHLW